MKDTKVVHISTGIKALDKVLSGGVVPGSTLLLGGPRGVGRTTLLLQACEGFARSGRKAYFASGEMTTKDISNYSRRLAISNESVGLFGDPVGVDIDNLLDDVIAFGAKFLVIDSMRTAYVKDSKGEIGSMAMSGAVANVVTSFAQVKKVAVIMVDDLLKGDNFHASAKTQHLVDGLLKMDLIYRRDGKPIDRLIREISIDRKYRYGACDVTALAELGEYGFETIGER